jgi:hypothetical protein
MQQHPENSGKLVVIPSLSAYYPANQGHCDQRSISQIPESYRHGSPRREITRITKVRLVLHTLPPRVAPTEAGCANKKLSGRQNFHR